MNLFKLLREKSRLFYVFTVLLGFINSLTNLGILIMVNSAISGKQIFYNGQYNCLIFAGLILFSFISSWFFQNYMVVITSGILYNLELSIVQKVRNATFESFEALGTEKLYAAISDARILSRAPEIFITLINGIVTVLCSIIYLMWISPLGGISIVAIMAVLLAFYLYRNTKLEKNMNEIRDLQNNYYGSLNDLLGGFKQVRISAERSNTLYNDYIHMNRDKARSLNVNTSRSYVFNELLGAFSWYVLLGVIIFLLPVLFKFQVNQIAAFITAVLFMMAPISQLIMFFPFQTNFKIALERINQIYKELEVDSIIVNENAVQKKAFQSIRFEDVTYHYIDNKQQAFVLEPLNITINAGELIFVTGANGSGKSTFVNLLTGLCKPTSGRIFVDEKEVTREEYVEFCNNMTAIYTSHYTFRRNYDKHDFSDENLSFSNYASMLNLVGILKTTGNMVDTNLSKGQQKRLALLLGLMEGKSFLVLDEWAAEQDPSNRKYFYTQWLDEIRKSEKTIIAVSHDDDYYFVADRVIKFDFGRIISGHVNV